MIYGLDTGVLIAAEVDEHPDHKAARETLARLAAAGDQIAVAPQVMTEFLHVVTDARRFAHPRDMATALRNAEQCWNSREVVQVFPNDLAIRRLFDWMRQYSLGRKRILDTLLAATYYEAGVTSILTTNPADFAVFGAFTCITPTKSTTP